jgi:hypothetical protein
VSRLVFLAALLSLPVLVEAGAFIGSQSNVNRVAHPPPYTGAQSGEIVATVCLAPGSPVAAEIPTRNAVATFNRMLATLGNNVPGSSVGKPGGRPDYESVLLHELGHCIGLDHSTLGPSELSTSDFSDPRLYYTIATAGPNGILDTGAGTDSVRASRDDVRGDDVNRHWYRNGTNNPFEIPSGRIDRVTHSVALGNLPGGHSFVEAATSFFPCRAESGDTSFLRGQPRTQDVMFPVYCQGNVYRNLSPNDVRTLSIARAGASGDATQTSDNYSLRLNYIGFASSCNIKIEFVSSAGFAFCSISFSPSGNNAFIGSANARFQTFGTGSGEINWWFNPTDTSQDQHPLSVQKAGSGNGTVTSNPAGIHCGATCTAQFDDGTSVSLTATPATGSVFAGWSGACSGTGTCQVSMTQARSVTATFTLIPTFPLTVFGAGNGTVTSNPAGINCGGSCSFNFLENTVVQLFAAPLGNWTFDKWSGACSENGACSVTMSQARNVGASFIPPGHVFRNGFELLP